MSSRLSPAHITGMAALLLAVPLGTVAPGLAAVPLALFLLACTAAPMVPAFGFYLPIVSRGRRSARGVALTFDDGPDPQVTPQVLDLLDRHGAKATFFVIGRKAGQHPALLREILARGHALGNHSQTHPPFLMLQGRRAIAREVRSAQAAISASGAVPLAFRPPVGVTNPDLWPILRERGMFCVNFNRRAGDMGNRRVPGLARRLLRGARARDIILLHDTLPHRVPVDRLLAEFEDLLQGLERKHLPVLPLAELIGREVMAPGSAPADASLKGMPFGDMPATGGTTMTATVESILAESRKRMKSSIETLKKEMATVRTGRANAGILDSLHVEYYGAMMPLNQVAGVSVPEPSMLVITPFDKKAIKAIETAILKSELGLNPANDGNVVRLPIPPLNEERRKELTKVVSRMGEEIKTAVRNVRRDANDEVKKLEKDKTAPLSEDAAKKALDQVQKATDETIKEIDEMVRHKETEIMHV